MKLIVTCQAQRRMMFAVVPFAAAVFLLVWWWGPIAPLRVLASLLLLGALVQALNSRRFGVWNDGDKLVIHHIFSKHTVPFYEIDRVVLTTLRGRLHVVAGGQWSSIFVGMAGWSAEQARACEAAVNGALASGGNEIEVEASAVRLVKGPRASLFTRARDGGFRVQLVPPNWWSVLVAAATVVALAGLAEVLGRWSDHG